MTIAGSSFQSGVIVAFGDSSATDVVIVSDTIITAVTPAHPAGTVDVIATNPDSQADTLEKGYTFFPQPTVTSIDPTSGTELGGTPVTIAGNNFQSGATVAFGDSSATEVVVVGDTLITAVTPTHSASTVDVIVTNLSGLSDTLSDAFTFVAPPVVTSIDPTSGTELGGTTVTIAGSSFQSGSTVVFGDSSATDVVVVSDTIITAVTPAHLVGTVDLKVTNPDTQADTLENTFTFIAPPVVKSIDPTSGTELGGTPVTIAGSSFQSGATVAFGDSSATDVVIVSDTIITAVTPAHSAGTVDVIVRNQDVQADTLANGFAFVSIDAVTDTVSFDAVGDRAATEILTDTVKTNTGGTLRDSLLAVSYNVTGVLNPFVARVFDVSGSEPGVALTSKVIDPAGGLSQLGSEGFTRFEDGRVSLGITQGQTLFIAMELSSAVGPSIGVNIALDPRKSWTFDEIGGVTRWRRGSDFEGITGDGGFMIRTVTGIMGDVSKFPPGRGVPDGEIGTEDLDFVVDVVLSRISESGVSDVISGVDKVTRFLMDAVDGRGGGSDGIVNLFDILFVVDRL